MTELGELQVSAAILDEQLTMTPQTRLFFANLITIIDELSIVYGDGSPEGVVSAIKGKTYQDNNGIASAIRYAKSVDDVAGDDTLGWILI